MTFFDVLDQLQRDHAGFSAEIPDNWRQGRSIFGGLQAALGLAALRALIGDGLPLRTLQTTFVGPAPAGPVRLTASVLRRGKSATQAECRLLDGDQVVCLVVGIFGAPRSSEISIQPTAPAVRCSVDELTDLPFIVGVTPSFTQFFHLRWCEGGPPFSGATEAHTKVFVRLRESVRDAEANLVAVADAIPSPGVSLLPRPTASSSLTWTLELLGALGLAPDPQKPTLDIQRPAPDAWYLLDTEVNAGRDGYLNQSSTVWTTDGRAVALSRQSVAVFG